MLNIADTNVADKNANVTEAIVLIAALSFATAALIAESKVPCCATNVLAIAINFTTCK
jgi:hypothetical protein